MARVRSGGGRLLDWTAGALLRPWLARPSVTPAEIRQSRPQRLLVVRCHDQLGDTICALPVVQGLRDLYPDTHLTVACLAAQEPLFRHHPAVDAVLPLDHGRLNRSLRWAIGFGRRLRAVRADGAFVLNSVSFSTTSALVAGCSGARWIAGSDAGSLGWTFPAWLYSVQLPFAPVPAEPAVEHALRPLRAAGFPLRTTLPAVGTGAADDRAARAFLAPLGDGPRIAIHAGAGKPENRWPVAHFVALIGELERWGAKVWLVDGPADHATTREVLAQLGRSRPRLVDTDLCVVAAALRQSAAVVGNDTGILHLAGAVGARSVALFGPTDARVWAPAGGRIRALQSADGRMESITVASVLNAVGLEQEGGDATRAPAP